MRVGLATVAVALAVALTALGFAQSPAALTPQSVSAASGPSLPLAGPKFFHSGGPYIGEQRALDSAGARANGPIAREEVRQLSYGAVVAWLGSENLYYARDREMYVAAISARFEGGDSNGALRQPGATPIVCNSYFVVIDATDGTVLTLGCGGPGSWPNRLPAVFQN
jgi:hypothetical protein